MNTRQILSFTAALALLVGAAQANDGTIRPPSQCLKIDRVSDWKVIDNQHLMVKALGGRYFDIRLERSCQRLASSSYLSFRDGVQPLMNPSRPAQNAPAQNPTTTDGRICGDIGDAVIPRDGGVDMTQIPCDIASIRRIDQETWKAQQTKTGKR